MLGCLTSCDKCKARIICGGGCFAKGFEKTGMLQMTDPLEQKFMLIIHEISEQIHQVLEKNRPPLFLEWRRTLGVEEFCDE
jgi:sulfatase maturation enzyme AslB (radical SAM superfamily)